MVPAAQPSVLSGGARRVLLRGGVVLSLDPTVGDFERADVLIEGQRIAAVGPNHQAGDAPVVECAGTIVMPGFITTHHHQYEMLPRSLICGASSASDRVACSVWPRHSPCWCWPRSCCCADEPTTGPRLWSYCGAVELLWGCRILLSALGARV